MIKFNFKVFIIFIIITIVIVLLLGVILNFVVLNNTNEKLVGPQAKKTNVVSNQPQEIKYDASTDLKKELEDINPQVLDSDFDF